VKNAHASNFSTEPITLTLTLKIQALSRAATRKSEKELLFVNKKKQKNSDFPMDPGFGASPSQNQIPGKLPVDRNKNPEPLDKL
jgi:hypothetical protein